MLLAWASACNCGGGSMPDGGTDAGPGGGRAGGSAGAGGGTATGGGAATGGGVGGSGGGSADGGPPNPLLPRLVVASRGASGAGGPSVLIWDRANTLESDVAPSVTLSGVDAPAAALAADALNLYVVHETTSAGAPVLQRYAAPRTLDGGQPAARISAGTFGPVPQVADVQLDAIGALWLQRSPGEVLRIDNVANATSATGWSARYTHPFDQIGGFAFEQTNNRLFAGQVSGAGILVWGTANTRTGDAGLQSFVLSTDTVAQLEIGANRLFGSFFGTDVKVWNNAGIASAPRAFDFALDVDAGTNASIRDQAVFHDTLVVTVQPTPTTGQVHLWKQISLVFTRVDADVVVEHPMLGAVTKAALGRDGTLYVLDPAGVSIFSDALTAPVFKTKLQTDIFVAADLKLLE